MQQEIKVLAAWDEEAGVWFATSEEIAGLVVEHETLEGIEKKAQVAIWDLADFEANAAGKRAEVWVNRP